MDKLKEAKTEKTKGTEESKAGLAAPKKDPIPNAGQEVEQTPVIEESKEQLQERMRKLVEEKKKAGEQWGKKFNEECFRFEREWTKLVTTDEKGYLHVIILDRLKYLVKN